MLTRDELEQLIRTGEIDTVLMVFPDLQGRLTGKRTTAASSSTPSPTRAPRTATT
jgi:glutamine synthetase